MAKRSVKYLVRALPEFAVACDPYTMAGHGLNNLGPSCFEIRTIGEIHSRASQLSVQGRYSISTPRCPMT